MFVQGWKTSNKKIRREYQIDWRSIMTVFSCYIGTTWICDQKLDKDGDGNFVFNPQIHSILWEMESIFSAIQNYLATFSISKDK